jgi:transcriptional regulator with XRE-family HTH domain
MTQEGQPSPEIAHSIDLDLPRKLRDDPEYRRKFFLAESSAEIAEQLIALRKRRGLTQAQIADATGTKQPAISRAEQADYQNHNLGTLRSIAQTLDARVRVLIQAYEDILVEYEAGEDAVLAANAQTISLFGAWQPVNSALSLLSQPRWAGQQLIGLTGLTGLGWGLHTPFYNALHYTPTLAEPRTVVDHEKTRLQLEIATLQELLMNKQRIIESLTSQVTTLMLNFAQEAPPTSSVKEDILPKRETFANRFQDQASVTAILQ